MSWPQIGEYTENGKIVKVYKPGHAYCPPQWYGENPLAYEGNAAVRVSTERTIMPYQVKH